MIPAFKLSHTVNKLRAKRVLFRAPPLTGTALDSVGVEQSFSSSLDTGRLPLRSTSSTSWRTERCVRRCWPASSRSKVVFFLIERCELNQFNNPLIYAADYPQRTISTSPRVDEMILCTSSNDRPPNGIPFHSKTWSPVIQHNTLVQSCKFNPIGPNRSRSLC